MTDKIEHLQRLLRERIVIMDGAMGTELQRVGLKAWKGLILESSGAVGGCVR